MIRLLTIALTLYLLALSGCEQPTNGPAQSVSSPGGLAQVTDGSFQKVVLENEKPVLVDCWATWCAPCKLLAPTIQELADEFEGRVDVVKLNVEEAEVIARKYELSKIPTVLIFHNGQVISRRDGVQPKGNYASDLEKILDLDAPSS